MRLTITIRETITNRIVDHGFKSKIDEAHIARGKAGDALYNLAYPAGIQMIMAKLPKDAFKQSQSVTIYTGGYYQFALSEARPIFAEMPRLNPADRVVADAIEAYNKESAKLEELLRDRRAEFAKVGGILGRFHSTEKLLEAWPEIEAFVPAIGKSPVAAIGLPAELIPNINARLGLPPTVAKAA